MNVIKTRTRFSIRVFPACPPTCHISGRGDGGGGGTMGEGGRSACAGPAAPAMAPTAAMCVACVYVCEGRDSARSVASQIRPPCDQFAYAPAIDPPQARLSRLLTPAALAPPLSSPAPRCRASRRISPRPRPPTAGAALLLAPPAERKAAASWGSRRPRPRRRRSRGKCRGSRRLRRRAVSGDRGGGMAQSMLAACVVGVNARKGLAEG